MSHIRRQFTSKFKADIVLNLLKGEQDLKMLAAENQIQPNLIRNWEKAFLASASLVFDDSRENNLRSKLNHMRIFGRLVRPSATTSRLTTSRDAILR